MLPQQDAIAADAAADAVANAGADVDADVDPRKTLQLSSAAILVTKDQSHCLSNEWILLNWFKLN